MKTNTLFVLILALMSGCATTSNFKVGINSYGRSIPQDGNTYILVPSEKGTTINDLEFIEFSAYVERALREKGMKRVSESDSPDIAIFLYYGIGDPETSEYSYSLPIWGQTGVSSSYTSGSVNVYGNSATYSGTTTYTPTYGITGYRNIQESYTTFTRHIDMVAYDINEYRRSGEGIVLWDTRITSIGRSGDLRRVFPIMIAAAIDLIGTNTGKMIIVSLKETDEEVKFLKGEILERKR
jgi:hypothetical protein